MILDDLIANINSILNRITISKLNAYAYTQNQLHLVNVSNDQNYQRTLYENSECKDRAACRSGSMSLNGHVEAVATLLLEAKLRRCADAIDRKCSDIGAIKGETSIGMGADITMLGLIYMGDSCPVDCTGGRIGRLAGVARVVASITVGNIYEDSISVDPELVVWEGTSFGEACGR